MRQQTTKGVTGGGGGAAAAAGHGIPTSAGRYRAHRDEEDIEEDHAPKGSLESALFSYIDRRHPGPGLGSRTRSEARGIGRAGAGGADVELGTTPSFVESRYGRYRGSDEEDAVDEDEERDEFAEEIYYGHEDDQEHSDDESDDLFVSDEDEDHHIDGYFVDPGDSAAAHVQAAGMVGKWAREERRAASGTSIDHYRYGSMSFRRAAPSPQPSSMAGANSLEERQDHARNTRPYRHRNDAPLSTTAPANLEVLREEDLRSLGQRSITTTSSILDHEDSRAGYVHEGSPLLRKAVTAQNVSRHPSVFRSSPKNPVSGDGTRSMFRDSRIRNRRASAGSALRSHTGGGSGYLGSAMTAMNSAISQIIDNDPHGHAGPPGSTFRQSLFNSCNLLLGIGILALPLGVANAGWAIGFAIMFFCGALTNYTAKILARCLSLDSKLITFADIGYKAFGVRARYFISLLFCLELTAASTALVVLFGDAVSNLIPGLSSTTAKLVGFVFIAPTTWLPLRYLSYSSLIGITGMVALVFVVILDGAIKPEAPGSLRDPMLTSIRPVWAQVPLSFGLVMAGFAGHAVFPNLCKDMIEPQQFGTVVDISYILVGMVYLTMGTCGYLMFGSSISSEITHNILMTPGYPQAINKFAVVLIALNPVSKIALTVRPIQATFEILLGFGRIPPEYGPVIGKKKRGKAGAEARTKGLDLRWTEKEVKQWFFKEKVRRFCRYTFRTIFLAAIFGIAIVFPSFDAVMGFLGAFSGFSICAVIPLLCNLRLFGRSMSKWHIVLDSVLIIISVVMGLSGTVWSFLPTATGDPVA